MVYNVKIKIHSGLDSPEKEEREALVENRYEEPRVCLNGQDD